MEPVPHLALCRDPHEDYLLEMALLGRADYLVTEDGDFHDDPNIVQFLEQRGVRLLHLAAFLFRAVQSMSPLTLPCSACCRCYA